MIKLLLILPILFEAISEGLYLSGHKNTIKMKTLLTLILSIFCLMGYSQKAVYKSSSTSSSNINEAAVAVQIGASLDTFAISVDVLPSGIDTLFGIRNDTLYAFPITVITDRLETIENLLLAQGSDLIRPTLDSANVRDSTIYGFFHASDTEIDSIPPNTAFNITQDGFAKTVDTVLFSATRDSIMIVLDSTITYGSTVLMDYTRAYPYVQDTSGNTMNNITNMAVGNYVSDPWVFVPEYQAAYDLMAVKPGLDTAVIQNIIVRSLVDSGYWERMDWFYWLAQKDSTASLLNWENPGAFSLTKSGVPTWTKYEGWTGDGVDAFLSTNWDAATNAINFEQDSATIGVYVLSETSVTVPAIGTTTTASYCMIEPLYNTSWLSAFINGGQILVSGRSTSRGLFMITRTASNAIEVYHNGASLGSDTDASGALRTDDFVILRNGTSYYTGQVAVAFSMDGISDTEAANINTIIETGMDAIGKGVQ